MVFGMSEQFPMHWSFVLLIGLGLCGYLRRHLPKGSNDVFQIMKIKSQTTAIIYFVTLAISGAWLLQEHPEIFTQNPFTRIVALFLVVTPFVPSLLKHEYNLFKEAGTNNA